MVEEKELDMIAKAHLAAERLEKANELHKELIKRQEALEARRLLGGQSSSGSAVQELSEKDKLDIELKNFWKGSALEKVFQ